jgi:hypothetical protein
LRARHAGASGLAWATTRSFAIDVTVCANPRCGGKARIIAWITDPEVIDRILNYLANAPTPPTPTTPAPASARDPPQRGRDWHSPERPPITPPATP